MNIESTTVHQYKVRNGDRDDDGKPRRTGTMWTASALIITGVIGSGILSLSWAVAQLGWIGGPATLFIFALITLYTSALLADCYRSPDPATGTRNYSYMEAVRANLGNKMSMVCGFTQYTFIFGMSIGYTITASISIAAISKSNCFHNRGHDAPCKISTNLAMVSFGICEIILSQIPSFHKLSMLSFVAAIMSFFYAIIGVVLSMVKIISGDVGKTSLKGAMVMINLTEGQKMWRMFRGLGNIAFAYAFSQILIEIQDTLRSPSENKAMKKAILVGVSTTTLFYMLCGCIGYAAFGSEAPGNMLTSFGFYEPYWLVILGNICIVVHLVGAFQVFIQALYGKVESWAARRWPKSKLITREYPVSFLGTRFSCSFNIFRLAWRSALVVLITVLAMALPFFNDILALLGAIGYWPLTIYFPIKMYITQKKIKKFTSTWVGLQLINFGCLFVGIAAACGSIQGIVEDLHLYKPFKSKQ